MITNIIDKFDKKFLKVKLEPIQQKRKIFYLAKIQAEDFLNLYTVEPATYNIAKQTSLASQFSDDENYYNFLIQKDKEKLKDEPFEREESTGRITKIRDFLENEEYAFFPNAIIVTCDLINDSEFIIEEKNFDEFNEEEIELLHTSKLSFLEKNETETYLYIPYQEKSLIIIDGQHRIKGLGKSNDTVKSKYDLIITFVIGFDRSIVAKQFYTINYNQKPVNKSVLYHLSGEFSDELDEITFLHEIIKILNEIDYSPFFKRIKMLGTIPSELSPEEKAKMTISQAFLIDYLKRTILKSSKNSIYQPIFLYYYIHKNMRIEIVRFLIKYFKAIENIKSNDWNNPQESIICKTIGIGALIRVLHFLFIKIFLDDFQMQPNKIKEIKTNEIKTKLDGIQNVDFSKEGIFGKVASAGNLNKLKGEIIINLNIFSETNYDDFISNFTGDYLEKYKKWLNKNI